MDLGTFYREFQNPPQLSSLSIDIGAQSMAEDLVWNPEISVCGNHMYFIMFSLFLVWEKYIFVEL